VHIRSVQAGHTHPAACILSAYVRPSSRKTSSTAVAIKTGGRKGSFCNCIGDASGSWGETPGAHPWTLLVLEALEEHGRMRFTRLGEFIGGVSQKMLTKTLRQMEADGLVSRTVSP